jgi:flagellin-like hook-associated protein FlgL
MTQALSGIASYYQTQANAVAAQIASINSQISAGTNVLTVSQQKTVTTLSQKASSYSTPEASIKNAQSVVALAQTGLTSIKSLLQQMQVLAEQASDTQLSSSDSTNFNTRFQSLVTQIGKAATSASLNGSSLLSGTAGLNVTTDITKGVNSYTRIQSVNVYGMLTAGILSGVAVDSPEKAQTAIEQISGALSQISSGQAALNYAASSLTKQNNTLTGDVNSIDAQINSITNVNVKQLQAQLTTLHNQYNVDYSIASQLNASASENL